MNAEKNKKTIKTSRICTQVNMRLPSSTKSESTHFNTLKERTNERANEHASMYVIKHTHTHNTSQSQ